ncbi:HAMP domain-containing sensor histidine kinase [Clostridium lundense]|uniref:HAMP domain-containing sensor histidine kinase n=1 Tax=Clostridium lundense TaxID=319475 RepID=UPI000488DDD3|nr:HAMP domain-containing sensor histidine kinase [Clostridium lundense]
MEKITKKLIKNFFFMITIVVTLCFMGSSIFLSKFYIAQQYNDLKNKCESAYDSIKNGTSLNTIDIPGFIIKNKSIFMLGKGRMGMMGFIHNIDTLNEKGTFRNGMNEEFLYYKLNTDLGEIVVFQNIKTVSEYLKITYIILTAVFLLALILSIPFISLIGKKFTYPILKLQKASNDIANGNFSTDIKVSTGDEIEDLSLSLHNMALNLEKKYSLQRDFIANVSHDFKTPLSIIRNYSEAIEDGLVSLDEAKKYSKEIINEVDKLNSLVIDILELSKLQEGIHKLNKDYINLYDLLYSCLYRFLTKAEKRGIKINLNFELNNKNIYIYGNKNALERVLFNFIDNSIKFSPDNSTIDISSKYNNSDIIISVKDNGLGIEENKLSEIWNRYYKHSESGGMGLGLAICSEILKLHDFQYGVNSKINEGSIFYFIINNKYIKNNKN